MALQLKQSLSLTQQLIMTPQLQQAIKLLQLSRLELLDTIYSEMETNPMLEEQVSEDGDEEKGSEEVDTPDTPIEEMTVKEKLSDDVDWENYLNDYSTGWAETPSYDGREMPSFESTTSERTNLYSHLMWQLNMSNFSDSQKKISVHIIGNLNPDGYLTVPTEELAEITGHSIEDVSETLVSIQKFDPVGVAALDT